MPPNVAIEIPPPLTSVVNYWLTGPTFSDESPSESQRTFATKPMYKLEVVKALAMPGQIYLPNSKKLQKDLENLEWGQEDVARAIQCLTTATYRKSLWCRVGKLWVPCDDYVMKDFSEPELDPPRPFALYLKMAVSPVSGSTIIVVSCHPSS